MVTAFTKAPVLWHFDYYGNVIFKMDASCNLSEGALLEHNDVGALNPITYYSKTHSLAECNYDIYNQALIAIFKDLYKLRSEYKEGIHTIHLITYNRNLQYCVTNTLLNLAKPWWSELLAHFDHSIVYEHLKSNGNIDALTRWPRDLADRGDNRNISSRWF